MFADTRMALAHKGLAVETVPWRFTEKDKLPQPNAGRVPVIADGSAMTGCLTQRGSGRLDLAGTGALVAALDLEAHALVAREVFEGQRTVKSTAMEEILLSILGGDEAEAAFGDDLLYGTSHSGLSNSFSFM